MILKHKNTKNVTTADQFITANRGTQQLKTTIRLCLARLDYAL